MDPFAVERAIHRWNGQSTPSGAKIRASIPHNINKERSYSNTSQTYQHSGQFEARDDLPHQRSMSVRGHVMNYNEGPLHSRQTSGPFPQVRSIEQLQSTIAEVIQHQSALERFSRQQQMPLGNVENTVNSSKKLYNQDTKHEQPGMSHSTSNMKKENVTPNKNNAPGAQGSRHKGSRKTSRQNT